VSLSSDLVQREAPTTVTAVKRPVAFTAVEIVVVVAIIALLAGILIPVVTSQIDDARSARALSDMDLIAKAFGMYRSHTLKWPGQLGPLAAADVKTGYEELTDYKCLYENSAGVSGWKGPYLGQGATLNQHMQIAIAPTGRSGGDGFLDPWGRTYRVYTFAQNNGVGGAIVIASRGPDGEFTSSPHEVRMGAPTGDDIVKVVSRRL
jgi:type II secretory pathway pseudopilin PulG